MRERANDVGFAVSQIKMVSPTVYTVFNFNCCLSLSGSVTVIKSS